MQALWLSFSRPFGYPRVSDVARPSVYCLLGGREINAVGVAAVFIKRVMPGRVSRGGSSSIRVSQAETIHARLKATFIAADSTAFREKAQNKRSEGRRGGSQQEPRRVFARQLRSPAH